LIFPDRPDTPDEIDRQMDSDLHDAFREGVCWRDEIG
jgi:hypothetical protein